MKSVIGRAAPPGVLLALLVAAGAHADTLEAYQNGVLKPSVPINTLWVVLCAILVLFMQAGFALLETGFSRTKNAGTVVAKILVNLSIAAIAYWAVGFAFAFGVGDIIGSDGFFLREFGDPLEAFPVMGLSDATIESKWLFQFAFCAVSLATAPSGYIEMWPAPLIGIVAGLIVVAGVITIDKKLDDPVGALSAHGLAGIWGTLACGFFTSPRLAQYNAFGDPAGGLWYSGSFNQLGYQALGIVVVFAFVFALSFGTFWLIKKTIGLRVSEDEEDAGLDIVEHGMYGYPEQFIPESEIGAGSTGPAAPAFARSPARVGVLAVEEVPA